jgi:hypothetical protein
MGEGVEASEEGAVGWGHSARRMYARLGGRKRRRMAGEHVATCATMAAI